MEQNNLVVEKIIYAKRKRSVGKDWVKDVLNLEIGTHLKNNPSLYFLKLGNVRENVDMSKTFRILFDLKSNQKASS